MQFWTFPTQHICVRSGALIYMKKYDGHMQPALGASQHQHSFFHRQHLLGKKKKSIKKKNHLMWVENWVKLHDTTQAEILKEIDPEYSLEGLMLLQAEAPVLWPPDAKSWLIGKDPDAGKDWRREEKGTTQDEMAGWHHRLDGHEFEQALGGSEGQGGLAWGHTIGSQRVRHDRAT